MNGGGVAAFSGWQVRERVRKKDKGRMSRARKRGRRDFFFPALEREGQPADHVWALWARSVDISPRFGGVGRCDSLGRQPNHWPEWPEAVRSQVPKLRGPD